jgi:hypothetical protein
MSEDPARGEGSSPARGEAARIVAKPNTMRPDVRSQVVDMPVGSEGRLLMVGDPRTQATPTQSAPPLRRTPFIARDFSRQGEELYEMDPQYPG